MNSTINRDTKETKKALYWTCIHREARGGVSGRNPKVMVTGPNSYSSFRFPGMGRRKLLVHRRVSSTQFTSEQRLRSERFLLL